MKPHELSQDGHTYICKRDGILYQLYANQWVSMMLDAGRNRYDIRTAHDEIERSLKSLPDSVYVFTEHGFSRTQQHSTDIPFAKLTKASRRDSDYLCSYGAVKYADDVGIVYVIDPF